MCDQSDTFLDDPAARDRAYAQQDGPDEPAERFPVAPPLKYDPDLELPF